MCSEQQSVCKMCIVWQGNCAVFLTPLVGCGAWRWPAEHRHRNTGAGRSAGPAGETGGNEGRIWHRKGFLQ